MKKFKSIISLLLIFIMIAGVMPAAHAEDSITIVGLNLPVNMTKSVKFYLKNMPEGFGKATVDIDDTNVRTISEKIGNTYYRVELEPEDYLTPGTHVVKVSAGDMVVTKNVEFYYPALNTNIIDTDMDGLSDASSDVLEKTDAQNYTDLTSVVSNNSNNGVTLGRKSGLGGNSDTDYALAFIGKTGNTNTTASYIEKSFPSNINSGIVEVEFSFYREGGTIGNLQIQAPRPVKKAYGYGYIPLTSGIVTSGIWYNVRLFINLSERTWAYEINNGGGTITSGSGILEKEDMTMSKLRVNMTPQSNDTSFVAIDNFRVDTYTPVTKDVMITSPADGDRLDSCDTLAVNVSAPDSDSVTLYVDGTKMQTISAADGSADYAFSINEQDVGRGIKSVCVVAFSGTTPIGADSVNINLTGHSALTTATNGNFQDFNTMSELNAKSDATTLDAFANKYGWRVNQGYLSLSRTTGRTGEAGDWAPLFQHFAPGVNAGNNPTITLDGANPLVEFDGGRIVYDFWFKKYTADNLYFRSVALWHNDMTFIKDGKLNGTDCEIKAGEWYHFKMILDRDNKGTNGRGLWYVYVNDTLVVNGVEQGESTNMKGNSILFTLSKNKNTIPAGIALDDVRIYLEKDDPTIDSIICTNADEEEAPANGSVSTEAKSISLTLSKALAVSDDNVELYVDGNLTAHGGVSVSSKTVTINLPKLSASSDVKIVLKNTIEGLETDLSVYFNVTDELGFYAKVVNYNISSDAAGAVVHSIAPSVMAADAYVATYRDKCLNDLSVKPLTIKEGENFTAITKNNLSAFETAKIMLWDENLRPIIGDVSNE